MPTAWFLTIYKTGRKVWGRPTRYCAMDDFTELIFSGGGNWSETEVLGNYALVKVRASVALLSTIADAPGFYRVPVARLTETFGSLSQQTLLALRNRVIAMGYTAEEISAALPANWRQITLGQLARFIASRRLKPRYDAVSGTIVLDGIVQTCKDPAIVDTEIPDEA